MTVSQTTTQRSHIQSSDNNNGGGGVYPQKLIDKFVLKLEVKKTNLLSNFNEKKIDTRQLGCCCC